MEDFQFYPTPDSLARRAWKKFQNKEFVRVLEPSAGNGDLAKGHPWSSERSFYYKRSIPIDCCELDVGRHAVLRDKGFNVVGIDFLKFGSGSIYSHIIMNPPFAEGAKHVLKAWDILWDGEIVAILNAETVRNPFSRERQLLVSLIELHGDVEFIEGAFSNAERTTDVDVALVYLRKHADVANDIVGDILSGLARDDDGTRIGDDFQEAREVALPNSFIENAVRAFNAAVQTMRDAVTKGARARYYAALLGDTMAVRNGEAGRGLSTDSSVEWVRKTLGERYGELKDRAWASILRSTDTLSKLSSAAQKRVESEFEQIKQLEFTVSNIYGFLCGLVESQGEIQLQMACDVFDEITKYYSDNTVFYRGWKSNDKHRTCGKRIKMTRFVLPHHSTFLHSFQFETERLLADFDKVFAMLDSKVEPEVSLVSVSRAHFNDLRNGKRVESSYFDIRYYRGVGTIHFFPRRKDLIDRLNRMVGRHRRWLPPEGERVSDDFWLQYDQAEKLDKEVREEIKGVKVGFWGDPFRYLNSVDPDDRAKIQATLDGALSVVQHRHGIDADALLEPPQQQRQLGLVVA